MNSKNDPPLVRIERQWLEAIEELNDYNAESYRDVLITAIRKAAGDKAYLSVNGFSDELCQHYWNMTVIKVADKGSKSPGYICLK